MKTFPFPASPSEAEETPLWKPTPGKTYYMPLADTELEVKVWNGGENDQRRLSCGLVYKSQYAASSMRRYLAALAKLWKYAALFHVEGENHSYLVDMFDGKLGVWSDAPPSILPRFHTKELATIALDRLSEAEQQSLMDGPLWT